MQWKEPEFNLTNENKTNQNKREIKKNGGMKTVFNNILRQCKIDLQTCNQWHEPSICNWAYYAVIIHTCIASS